ncbi:MAG: hypothetical protein HYX42_15305 [Polaromonas sp.]|uniref:FFLEELY motif protein n=1 Tax=Polaromonas sp. TaxID=1869339 RepID=UPI0025E642DF|nr:hypothetical protein [Polaromonas sp.]MBI2727607.1 hypothetical protein [Polaromonas sp.]
MDSTATRIHEALQAVALLRAQHVADAELLRASASIKRFQARRFRATYADVLVNSRYKTAAAFFLHELYSDKDYAERDQQFARIANTIAKLFPQAVVNTALALVEVHALTEKLDDLMARQWLASLDALPELDEIARYIACWRQVGDIRARHKQLEVVLLLGKELNRLTRMPGLRTLLKMMRHPASVAGLSSLQGFLEAGFDAFAGMRGADDFLQLIEQRETEWLTTLFADDTVTCETKLGNLLDSSPPS